MSELTKEFQHWLWENHNDKIGLILWGHTELITEEMEKEYLAWCKTEEGKKFLQGERE